MIITIKVRCSNSPNETHDAVVQVDGWNDWTIVETDCTQKYGRMFGMMSQCSKINENIEYNIINKIIEINTPEAVDIILDGIESITPFTKNPFNNPWLKHNTIKMLSTVGEEHLKRILDIYQNKDFGLIVSTEKMLTSILKNISEQQPNPIIAQTIQEIILNKETIEDNHTEILRYYPEYALETAEILFKQNKLQQIINILKDTNTYKTKEGYKILKLIAQRGYYEAIGLCNIIENSMPEITQDS
ncbi:MAG: hypothetical protein KatS3mg087_1514 [Patescibacteria group bacterium]|nr:MAG: hypothetical protein KatS3mg087_1514 [Patescibacteria group bacterium]